MIKMLKNVFFFYKIKKNEICQKLRNFRSIKNMNRDSIVWKNFNVLTLDIHPIVAKEIKKKNIYNNDPE